MTKSREKVVFENRDKINLSGLMEWPEGTPDAFVLFAHCFTCGKDISSASRISRALAKQGFAVLRFDFTGLGGSDGDFANSNFSSNVQDLVSAAGFLERTYQAPAILIGHSLGGTAVISAAAELPSVKAIATIGSPASPAHVAHNFSEDIASIEQNGLAKVSLAGREFTIKKQFLEDISTHPVSERLRDLKCAKLFLHSPTDEIVPIKQAAHLYEASKHPKSFISLDGADHLLTRRVDAEYVAGTIATWAARYTLTSSQGVSSDKGVASDKSVTSERIAERPEVMPGKILVLEENLRFTRTVYSDEHQWLADEPEKLGGDNRGADPYEHLLAALGICTSMTMRMYASRKKLPVDAIDVELEHKRLETDEQAEKDCGMDHPNTPFSLISRKIKIAGPELKDEQRTRLMEIADKCPVHKTLSKPIVIKTELDE